MDERQVINYLKEWDGDLTIHELRNILKNDSLMHPGCESIHGSEPHEHCPVCGDVAHVGIPLNCGLGLGHK